MNRLQAARQRVVESRKGGHPGALVGRPTLHRVGWGADFEPVGLPNGIRRRGAGNQVLIADPRVSAEHARMLWHDGRWWIEDAGSVNGTFVNEQRISRPTAVGYADTVRLGPAVLRVQASKA